MELIYQRILKITNLKVIGIFFVLFVVAVFMVNVVFKTEINYLTQTFNYTSEEAYKIINSYGESGRILHLRILFVDIILVILYTVLFSTATVYIAKSLFPSNEFLPRLSLMPVVLSIIQMIEIVGLFIILSSYPTQLFGLVKVINIVTVIKYILTSTCILMLIIGFISLFMKRMFMIRKA